MATHRDYSKSMGYRPDLPDFRDLRYAATKPVLATLPPKLSWKTSMGPVLDQGPLGSCTANAIAQAVRWLRKHQGLKDWLPSRLAIYYDERAMEGSVDSDAGAYIRDGFKVINHLGCAPEALWPYDVSKFTRKPPAGYYTEALTHQALKYQRVDNRSVEQMKAALFAVGPVVGGISVYESFISAHTLQTGNVPLPQPTEGMIGGHAICFTGYSDLSRTFQFVNSWSAQVGRSGYFRIPYSYVTNPGLASDFWAVSLLEAE